MVTRWPPVAQLPAARPVFNVTVEFDFPLKPLKGDSVSLKCRLSAKWLLKVPKGKKKKVPNNLKTIHLL